MWERLAGVDFSPRNWYKYLGQGEGKIDQSDASGAKTAGGKEQIESKNKEIERSFAVDQLRTGKKLWRAYLFGFLIRGALLETA
jgi:hypothetical protein